MAALLHCSPLGRSVYLTSAQRREGGGGKGGGSPHPALNYHFLLHTLLQSSVPAAARHHCVSAYSCGWRSAVQEVTLLLRSGSGETSAMHRPSPVPSGRSCSHRHLHLSKKKTKKEPAAMEMEHHLEFYLF